jgi:TRAP-type mannitol/chloroaromatic compound transport system substrate-binding protein
MRNTVIGLIVGTVLGVVLGATVIAPRLERAGPGVRGSANAPAPTASEMVKQMPRALVVQPDVSLRMASSFPLDTPIAGSLARRIDSRIWELSHGKFEIRSYAPRAEAPATDFFDAVGSGAIDAALAAPAMGASETPALQIFSGVPFGPSDTEFLAWLDFGGGRELLDEINHARNVHGLICGLLPPSAFGWFREEVRAPSDLEGLRMQIEGLGAKVLAQLGVEVVDLSPGDLILALEHGTVDAVSYGSPVIDQRMEFGTWLKNYYPEGWSNSLTPLELMINLKSWDGLTASQKAQIETICGDNIRYSLSEGEATQFQALKTLVERGVRLQRLPPGVRNVLEQSWQKVLQQEGSADPDFRRVWQSLATFRSDFAIWRELSRP